MPIMTQQYLTVVYIICTGLQNRGGNAPPTVKLGAQLGGQMPPCPPQFRRLCVYACSYTKIVIEKNNKKEV